jgi:TPR repeat protein
MKKGLLLAVSAAVLAVAAAGVWWWSTREAAPAAVATDANAGKAESSAESSTLPGRSEQARLRIEAHRRLWRDASYIDVRQSAQDGDLVAQRRLSEIYEDCRAYGGSLQSNMELLRRLAGADRGSKAAVDGIYHDNSRLCGQADADMRKNPGLAEYWLHKSAKAGDLTSEMRYFSRTVTTLSPKQFQYFVEKLRDSGDPDAMFELALLLSKLRGDWPDPSQAPAFKGESAQYAWMLAACRAGYDCTRGSRTMNLLCVGMFACSSPDYEHYLLGMPSYLSSRDQVARLVNLIESSILAPKKT